MINKHIIVGNLGQDPSIKSTNKGGKFANFSVATTEKWRNAEGEMQEQTEWHFCVAWSGLADIVEKYLRKGSQVYIEGRSQTRKWTDNDGIERYSTEIVVKEMKMLGGRPQENRSQGGGYQKDSQGNEMGKPGVPF